MNKLQEIKDKRIDEGLTSFWGVFIVYDSYVSYVDGNCETNGNSLKFDNDLGYLLFGDGYGGLWVSTQLLSGWDWIWNDDDNVYEELIKIIPTLDGYEYYCDEDELTLDFIRDNCKFLNKSYHDKYKALFFTRQDAEKYIKNNKHRFDNPFIHEHGIGQRNQETYELFEEIFKSE